MVKNEVKFHNSKLVLEFKFWFERRTFGRQTILLVIFSENISICAVQHMDPYCGASLIIFKDWGTLVFMVNSCVTFTLVLQLVCAGHFSPRLYRNFTLVLYFEIKKYKYVNDICESRFED